MDRRVFQERQDGRAVRAEKGQNEQGKPGDGNRHAHPQCCFAPVVGADQMEPSQHLDVGGFAEEQSRAHRGLGGAGASIRSWRQARRAGPRHQAKAYLRPIPYLYAQHRDCAGLSSSSLVARRGTGQSLAIYTHSG